MNVFRLLWQREHGQTDQSAARDRLGSGSTASLDQSHTVASILDCRIHDEAQAITLDLRTLGQGTEVPLPVNLVKLPRERSRRDCGARCPVHLPFQRRQVTSFRNYPVLSIEDPNIHPQVFR